ncbi:unnamed protein product [Alopecurus aequalis]
MSTKESELERMLIDESVEPGALSLSFLEKITYGFSDDMVIGRGGFAVVYMGILDNGAAIAVKKIRTHFYMPDKKFQGEVACLMKAKHKNIVRFLGYCADTKGSMEMYDGHLVMADTQERLMCFEYLPNGSLEHYIKDTSGGLQWRKWYRIIKGVCEGLHYLHENYILHLDLKPSNILMDEEMMPKLIDFGGSRCFDEGQMDVTTITITGTMGYMAPELLSSGKITYRSDLFSLGVIIKEILTGEKGHQDRDTILQSWRDRSDQSQWEQIRVCTEIGIQCTDYNPANRPESIKHIIDRLLETERLSQAIPAHGPSELLVVHQFALHFPFEPNKVITRPLKLTNKTDIYIAFGLMDKIGESFLMLPLYGIVPPRSVHTIDVRAQEHKELPRKRNVDLILESAPILVDVYIRSLRSQEDNFSMKSKTAGNLVQEITLKAFLTPQREMIGSSKINKPHHISFEHTTTKPLCMRLSYLEDITNNFCDERILGNGAFSLVYKGVLPNTGQIVAVKRLMHKIPTSEEHFENEIRLLTKLEHPNIVRLLGYCNETRHLHKTHEGKFVFVSDTEYLICFEGVPNGSLDKYISDVSCGLDWHTRCKIIQGISFGLQYLHEQANGPILHLDLKPANILLAENMVPIISDFGLSRLLHKNLTIHTADITGTLGYMPPESFRGIITSMHDIFSFGVIICEVITGHREYPYDIRKHSEEFIELEVEKWRNKLQQDREYAMLDKYCQQIKRCIQISLICLNPERHKRPAIKEIVDMLQGLKSMDWYITNERFLQSTLTF